MLPNWSFSSFTPSRVFSTVHKHLKQDGASGKNFAYLKQNLPPAELLLDSPDFPLMLTCLTNHVLVTGVFQNYPVSVFYFARAALTPFLMLEVLFDFGSFVLLCDLELTPCCVRDHTYHLSHTLYSPSQDTSFWRAGILQIQTHLAEQMKRQVAFFPSSWTS